MNLVRYITNRSSLTTREIGLCIYLPTMRSLHMAGLTDLWRLCYLCIDSGPIYVRSCSAQKTGMFVLNLYGIFALSTHLAHITYLKYNSVRLFTSCIQDKHCRRTKEKTIKICINQVKVDLITCYSKFSDIYGMFNLSWYSWFKPSQITS